MTKDDPVIASMKLLEADRRRRAGDQGALGRIVLIWKAHDA